jgi:hypothetical protein
VTEFKPDDVTTIGVADRPSDVVALIGYLGEGGSPAYRRLFKDTSLRKWAAIATSDIAEYMSVEGPDNPTKGKTLVWVYRSASIVMCESVPVSRYELPSWQATGIGAQYERPVDPSSQEDPGSYEWPRPHH